MFPGRQIILSDITPRTDNLDQAIINMNNAVHERIKDLPNVQHVYNGNLRQYKFFYDTKHLSMRLGIPLLAKNLKNSLRRAIRPQQRQGITNFQSTILNYYITIHKHISIAVPKILVTKNNGKRFSKNWYLEY
jgi:hypothetical protein